MDNFTIYFDTETGGTEPHHPTIQLAAVAVDANGDEVGAFCQNIAFNEADCDPEALAMNHYQRTLWDGAPTPAQTAARFAAWLRPYCSVTLTSKRTGNPYTVARLAGYNAVRFDEPRLRAMFGTMFCPWEYLARDVLQMALFHFDRYGHAPENFKLSTVAAYFGIPTDGAHDALADARMCAAVAWALREAW